MADAGGIYYNSKNSRAFGLFCESRNIGPPVKRKTEIQIPYRSSTIDLSMVNGIQTYDDRTLEFKFWKRCRSQKEVMSCVAEIMNWLLSTGRKTELRDTIDSTYKWMAECTNVDASASTARIARFTVTFKADPYRISQNGGKVL